MALNIAEGWARNSKAELARYSEISRGSLHEADAAFDIAIRLGYISKTNLSECYRLINQVSTMLLRLANALRK